MSALTFTIPGLPPSVNHGYGNTGAGGRRRTKTTLEWQVAAGQIAGAAAGCAEWRCAPAARLLVTIRFTMRHPLTWDLDNLLKLLIDALAAALDFDDRYIVHLDVGKAHGQADRTDVTVEAVP